MPFPVVSLPPRLTATTYDSLYAQSLDAPDTFWRDQARLLNWRQPWSHVKDTSFDAEDVHIRWFEGGMLNVAENCVDRHAIATPDATAIIWEPDDPSRPCQHISYAVLQQKVRTCARMLQQLGVMAGDRVTIYLPMVPEAAVAMLACARIGAVHSVVFGGFSPASLRSRIEDCGSKVVITADEGRRGGKSIALKANVDAACKDGLVEKVLVLRHTCGDIAWQAGRDQWWHELEQSMGEQASENQQEVTAFASEHPLFILYTSGSTGTPKGLLHTSAGYLLYAMHTFLNVFDYRAGEVFWCTADVGWITGHSYMVYGPLAAGATVLMFEGVPTYPDAARFWQIVDKHRVNILYTAPTAIRMLQREGDAWLDDSSRASLRVLGSVGEPINPEAWRWYDEVVGRGACAIVDTWWQTETGGHLISPLPSTPNPKPGAAMLPYVGVRPIIVSADGRTLQGEAEGALCIVDSWPGQARTIWGDHARFVETYFKPYPGYYFSGDAARRDADGHYWIEGRMDDVVNVSGHRLGTAEIESALVAHMAVTEAAVVGFPHDIKGQGVYAFVTLLPEMKLDDAMRKELNMLVRTTIGAVAHVDVIQDAPALPKTRSGKIMRRILRKIAAGEIQTKADFEKLGDISTLLNPESVERLVAGQIQH